MEGQILRYKWPATYGRWYGSTYSVTTSNFHILGFPVSGYDFPSATTVATSSSGISDVVASTPSPSDCGAPDAISSGSIAGAVVGGVLGLAGLACLAAAMFISRKGRRTAAARDDQPVSQHLSQAYTAPYNSPPQSHPSPAMYTNSNSMYKDQTELPGSPGNEIQM